MKNLPSYQSRIEIKAFKICEIIYNGENLYLYSENRKYSVDISYNYLMKQEAKIGGYCIIHSDGNITYENAEDFDKKYILIDDEIINI